MSKVRPVILHLQDGTTIEYGSMAILAESLGVHVRDLRECVKTGSYLDYNWMRVKVTYKDGLGPGSSVGDGIQALRESKSKNNKAFKTSARRIKAISPTGEEKFYESITEATKETGITRYMISRSLDEGIAVGDGWVFEDRDKNYKSRPRRIVNNKPVIAILPNGERREYQSIKRCADDLGISTATVRDRLITKRPAKQGIMFERA